MRGKVTCELSIIVLNMFTISAPGDDSHMASGEIKKCAPKSGTK